MKFKELLIKLFKDKTNIILYITETTQGQAISGCIDELGEDYLVFCRRSSPGNPKHKLYVPYDNVLAVEIVEE